MVSQPSGNSIEIISIETDNLHFVLKGDNESVGVDDNAKIEVDGCGNNIVAIFNEHMHLKEYKNYEVVIMSKNNTDIEFYHENMNIRNKITPIMKNFSSLSGIINFRGDIGYTDIIVRVNNRDEFCCRLEVYPSKLSYKEDYVELLRDINEEIYNLAYGFLRRTYLGSEIGKDINNSQTEFYSILNYVFKRLIKSVDVVINNPHHKLEKENTIVRFHQLKNCGNDTIKWFEKRPHMLGIEALQTKKTVTVNTKENRFVKFMLINIIKKIDVFLKLYNDEYKRGAMDPKVIKRLESYKRNIKMKINTSFLRDVQSQYNEASLSLVFTMGSGYKEIYKYYLMLQKGLAIKSNIMNISMKELSSLYEYWCFIKINSLLKKKYNLISADFMKINKNGINVTLKKGSKSSLKYEHPITKERFEVIYNCDRSSGTVGQYPDNILSIHKDGYHKAYEFIFDAKYKVDTSENYINAYGSAGPKVDDINTMHRYRDAIVYQNKKTNTLENGIFGAFVLFPYNNEGEFKNHKFYKSIQEVNIGAIPFLPSTTKLMEEFLDELINESSYTTFERALDQLGRENYLTDELFTNRNVLVGNVKGIVQLEKSLENNFYHVPKSNTNLIRNKIDYVALLQSKKYFGDESGIVYYGKIESIEEVKRSDIKEIPRNSDEIYYLIKIEHWNKLHKKIEVVGESIRRPEYTSEFLLNNSRILSELRIKTKDEYRKVFEGKRYLNK